MLQVVVCGSPLARDIDRMLRPAVAEDWDVWVVATPYGTRFFDVDAAARTTGNPVHSSYRHPADPVDVPYADVMAVVPATVNTVNKWAAGIGDTLALGLLTEALGRDCPIVAVPYSNRAHTAHPAFRNSLDLLRSCGVTVLFGDDFHPLHPPGEGGPSRDAFPWRRVWHTVRDLRPVRSRR
ncbi:flavoprotein [Stackebrandtia albiflava]